MKKVLLINPPVREYLPVTTLPIGLCYIASCLKKEHVRILDIQAMRYSEEELRSKIKYANEDIFLFGGLITTYNFLKKISFMIKKYHPDKKLIVGGTLASASEIVLKKTKTDIVVHGEGELTIQDLLNNLDNLEKVKGISFKKDNRIIKTESRKEIKNLDEIPFPSYEFLDISVYLNIKRPMTGSNSMDMIATRGCIYNCTFCYREFKTYRKRSVENIIEEIKYLISRYNIKAVQFLDENLLIDRAWVIKLCKEIEKLNIRFSCYGRIDNVNEKMLKSLKKAGCVRLGFGIESGSQKILNAIRKGYKVEQAKEGIELARKAKIPLTFTFMIGSEGENKETVQETIDFCKELNITIPSMFITTAYPSSELYKKAMAKGLIKDEESYISKLGDANKLLLNFSEVSNKELLKLKQKAEKETKRNIVKRAMDFYRYYGMEGLRILSNTKADIR